MEIIHLHDCLRGAVKALEEDVNSLSQSVAKGERSQLETLERRIAGRFKVIWSVFRAHSSAEDEFIWPALQAKTQGRVKHHRHHHYQQQQQQQQLSPKYRPGTSNEQGSLTPTSEARNAGDGNAQSGGEEDNLIEQSEYEEDHASEEIMFERIDSLLAQLRKVLVERKKLVTEQNLSTDGSSSDNVKLVALSETIDETAQSLFQHTKSLSKHLYQHLEKEENQCMPLVVKHLSRNEIHDLVGNIMGKRSSDLIAQIMTMAVQNLTHDEREEMIKYMKQAMEGTFFDRWLLMSGWMQSPSTSTSNSSTTTKATSSGTSRVDTTAASVIPVASRGTSQGATISTTAESKKRAPDGVLSLSVNGPEKRLNLGDAVSSERILAVGANITGQAELERLIRAVASNSGLTAVQKQCTIQSLRDTVFKTNQRQRETSEQQAHAFAPQATTVLTSNVGLTAAAGIRMRRATPPSVYLKKNDERNVEIVWSRYVQPWKKGLPRKRACFLTHLFSPCPCVVQRLANFQMSQRWFSASV